MNGRRLRAWIVAVALGVLALSARAAPVFDPFTEVGIDAQRRGERIATAARFTDQDGRSVVLGELLDIRPVLLVPVYYRCPNVCGPALATLFNMLANVSYRAGVDYQVIAFSFDPAETPEDARREQERLAKRWPQLARAEGVRFLTGAAADSEALAAAIGFRYRYDPDLKQYAHASAVAVLTADGRLSRWLYGLGYQPTDLRLGLTEAGQGKLGSLGEQLLLLCYHYDPQSGTYNSLVIHLLQVGGVGTALALAVFIGVTLRRERRAPDEEGGR
ncbi:SCO family protein [Pseudomonas sp. RIT-PI-AD]|uniref:SCO family protein n=1 Tax=Pseudomonas sp. RIT-PI-AD TaxID=3035294 RepID=UPI0021D7E195|nr:SCO family protein [Pseudomonas sp. RIT-PI-AD]